jgi:hypothetical protein
MEKEIQKTIKEVNRDKYELEKELEEPVDLDELELEKYIEFVERSKKSRQTLNDFFIKSSMAIGFLI